MSPPAPDKLCIFVILLSSSLSNSPYAILDASSTNSLSPYGVR